ncbi:MAG: hypothetical protein ACE5I1_17380, partial [bacterium]
EAIVFIPKRKRFIYAGDALFCNVVRSELLAFGSPAAGGRRIVKGPFNPSTELRTSLIPCGSSQLFLLAKDRFYAAFSSETIPSSLIDFLKQDQHKPSC